jgi:hypothetical protein
MTIWHSIFQPGNSISMCVEERKPPISFIPFLQIAIASPRTNNDSSTSGINLQSRQDVKHSTVWELDMNNRLPYNDHSQAYQCKQGNDDISYSLFHTAISNTLISL